MSKELVRAEVVDVGAIQAAEQFAAGGNPFAAIMASLYAKANTPEMVNAATNAAERLGGMFNTQEDRLAEKGFAESLCELQFEIPRQIATKIVTNRDGTERYRSQPLPELKLALKPYLHKWGFGVYTSSHWEGDRAVADIELIHRTGASRKSQFALLRSAPPPGGTATEGEEGTLTRAERRGLCAALCVAVSQEDADDAAALGDLIKPEQAADLKSRLKAVAAKGTRPYEATEKDFLNFVGAETFEAIRMSRYQEGLDMLAGMEAKAAKGKPAPSNTPPAESQPAASLFAGDFAAVKTEVQRQTGAETSEINGVIADLEADGIEITVATVVKALKI